MPRLAVLVVLAAAFLAWPAAPSADHAATTEVVVTAKQVAISDQSVTVEVSWSARCAGSTSVDWFGSLRLIYVHSGEEIYMGGVSSGSGTARQLVSRADQDRAVFPFLRISCGGDGHSGGTIEARGNEVPIPRRGASDPGSGGGGSGSGPGPGPGSGSGGGAPCSVSIVGTRRRDRLVGTPAPESIRGRAGSDVLTGASGDDCLYGSSGNDRLRGDDGNDRLFGGAGNDRLDGGRGTNAYSAGAGSDVVLAANGVAENVACGGGRDRARVDRADRVTGCERVTRVS